MTGTGFLDVKFFEAVIADSADHQKSHKQYQERPQERRSNHQRGRFEEVYNRSDHGGRSRDRQTDEVAFRTRLGRFLCLEIKPCKAKRSTNYEGKACQRSKLMNVFGCASFDAFTGTETPAKSQYGRG